MTTPLIIDSCAWNHFFHSNTDLDTELPPNTYSLSITSEIDIEIREIPDSEEKKELNNYIQSRLLSREVKVIRNFGFGSTNKDGTQSKYQIFGNFNNSGFQPPEHRDWYARPDVAAMIKKSSRPTPLRKNEGDASLAVRSFQTVVITAERRRKKGLLQLAADEGGLVVFLHQVEESRKTLHDYIQEILKQRSKP